MKRAQSLVFLILSILFTSSAHAVLLGLDAEVEFSVVELVNGPLGGNPTDQAQVLFNNGYKFAGAQIGDTNQYSYNYNQDKDQFPLPYSQAAKPEKTGVDGNRIKSGSFKIDYSETNLGINESVTMLSEAELIDDTLPGFASMMTLDFSAAGRGAQADTYYSGVLAFEVDIIKGSNSFVAMTLERTEAAPDRLDHWVDVTVVISENDMFVSNAEMFDMFLDPYFVDFGFTKDEQRLNDDNQQVRHVEGWVVTGNGTPNSQQVYGMETRYTMLADPGSSIKLVEAPDAAYNAIFGNTSTSGRQFSGSSATINVPEPSSFILFMLGIAVLAASLRKTVIATSEL